MRRLLIAVAVVLYAAPALAQTGTPTSYVFQVYVAGGAAAGPAVTIQAGNVNCGQLRVTGSSTNPTKWKWADPTDTTKDCIFDDTVRLTALSDGNYEGTIRAVNAAGSSAETARVPFTRSRPNPPAVPGNPRITD